MRPEEPFDHTVVGERATSEIEDIYLFIISGTSIPFMIWVPYLESGNRTSSHNLRSTMGYLSRA